MHIEHLYNFPVFHAQEKIIALWHWLYLRLGLMGLTSESDGKLEKKHPTKFVYMNFNKN